MKRWLVVIAALLLGVVVGVGVVSVTNLDEPVGSTEASRDTRVIEAVEREEQVVLVSLGIQGLAEERIVSTIFGKEVPGTGRVLFVQYSFRAKLGIEGGQVGIQPMGENAYRVSIPEFIFIGHDDVEFKTAVEKNGVLSWVTPEIDTAKVVTEILSEEALQEHVDANRDLLEEQARAFYAGIIQGIDPEIELVFEFPRAG